MDVNDPITLTGIGLIAIGVIAFLYAFGASLHAASQATKRDREIAEARDSGDQDRINNSVVAAHKLINTRGRTVIYIGGAAMVFAIAGICVLLLA